MNDPQLVGHVLMLAALSWFLARDKAGKSAEPPLLLISVDKKAESWPAFEESRVFTVNILADDQEGLSERDRRIDRRLHGHRR